MDNDELICRIALGNLPSVGDISARKLVEHFGSAGNIFRQSYSNLVSISGIGPRMARSITDKEKIDKASKELEFIRKHHIKYSFYTDGDYPARLNECPDSPVIIYYIGNLCNKAEKILSVVGTRNITRRGKELTGRIISELAGSYPGIVIVSGLAYGVDICAHRAALENEIPTVGIMAHGFSTIYPSAHRDVARQMVEKGALITDFVSGTQPERNNFLKRNRIIAGYSDATLVIESGIKGGAMVTADIAASYNRDIFAIPGSPGEKYSSGCNLLIKSQKATLAECAKDIGYFMNWTDNQNSAEFQKKIEFDLAGIEKDIVDLLSESGELSLELISNFLERPAHQLSAVLVRLEFAGLIKNIPGNRYAISTAKNLS